MKLKDFFAETDLNRSLLIGYYGGGNYGDELLLEVLQNLFHRKGVKDLTIAYQRPNRYSEMHHDFGNKIVQIHRKAALLAATRRSRNIIIGGGGLWGVDMNANTFILSVYLFLCRYLFRKKVYLLGVGYYNSTTRAGHIAAWFAGKAANLIIVRDDESKRNFGRMSSSVAQDVDMAFQATDIPAKDYERDVVELQARLPIKHKTLFITLRRFRHENNFNELVEQLIEHRPDLDIVIGLLELESVDRESFVIARQWRDRYPNVRILDDTFNPLGLFFFFQKHNKKLAVIGPQFHIIITAHLAGVKFMPITYDNKVGELYKQLNLQTAVPIRDLAEADLQAFVTKNYGDKA